LETEKEATPDGRTKNLESKREDLFRSAIWSIFLIIHQKPELRRVRERGDQRVLFFPGRCAILFGPYPAEDSIGLAAPRRISNFIVPSDCMIEAIEVSAVTAGIPGWRAL
jgi:hypothetical protein